MYILSLGIRTKCTHISPTYLQLNGRLYFKIQVHAPQNIGVGHNSSLIEYKKLLALWVLLVIQMNFYDSLILAKGQIRRKWGYLSTEPRLILSGSFFGLKCWFKFSDIPPEFSSSSQVTKFWPCILSNQLLFRYWPNFGAIEQFSLWQCQFFSWHLYFVVRPWLTIENVNICRTQTKLSPQQSELF